MPRPFADDAATAELLRLLIENLPALIAYYDAATLHCEFSNSRYARAFGWSRETVVGRHEILRTTFVRSALRSTCATAPASL